MSKASSPTTGKRLDGRTKSTILIEPSILTDARLVATESGQDVGQVIADALKTYLPRFKLIRALGRNYRDPAAQTLPISPDLDATKTG